MYSECTRVTSHSQDEAHAFGTMLVLPGRHLAPIVGVMSSHTERPDAGARIRAQRAFIGKSRPDIEKETGGLIYRDLQKRVEDGQKKVRTIHLRHLKAWIDALNWTPAQFEEATGVGLPETHVPGSSPFDGRMQVPLYGDVAAGIMGVEMDEKPETFIALDPTLPGLKGRKPSRLGVLKVNGNSMVSPNAAQTVPEGSLVLVEWGATPSHGDLVVAWLPEHETAVLKQFQEGRDIVLRSLNPSGPAFRASEEPDVRGVVRLVMRRP